MSYKITPTQSDLLTSARLGIRRLAVDSQQTSFEDNAQFRFFEDLSVQDWSGVDNTIPKTKTLVYRFSAVNPVNILNRNINLWQGGRQYLVFPQDGNETIDTGGAPWVDISDHIYAVNGNLREHLVNHPVSGVTVDKLLADSFTSTSYPRTGTAARADSTGNKASSSYNPDSSKAGVAGNQGFYLVFYDIAQGNDPSSLHFLLEFEERFNE